MAGVGEQAVVEPAAVRPVHPPRAASRRRPARGRPRSGGLVAADHDLAGAAAPPLRCRPRRSDGRQLDAAGAARRAGTAASDQPRPAHRAPRQRHVTTPRSGSSSAAGAGGSSQATAPAVARPRPIATGVGADALDLGEAVARDPGGHRTVGAAQPQADRQRRPAASQQDRGRLLACGPAGSRWSCRCGRTAPPRPRPW